MSSPGSDEHGGHFPNLTARGAVFAGWEIRPLRPSISPMCDPPSRTLKPQPHSCIGVPFFKSNLMADSQSFAACRSKFILMSATALSPSSRVRPFLSAHGTSHASAGTRRPDSRRTQAARGRRPCPKCPWWRTRRRSRPWRASSVRDLRSMMNDLKRRSIAAIPPNTGTMSRLYVYNAGVLLFGIVTAKTCWQERCHQFMNPAELDSFFCQGFPALC